MLGQAARGSDLGEHFPIVPPQSINALKRRAVVVSAVGDSTDTILPIEHLGTTLANLPDVDARRARAADRPSHTSVRMRFPGALGGIAPRVDIDLARLGIEHHL